jgi:hypothetical protein
MLLIQLALARRTVRWFVVGPASDIPCLLAISFSSLINAEQIRMYPFHTHHTIFFLLRYDFLITINKINAEPIIFLRPGITINLFLRYYFTLTVRHYSAT